MAILPALLFMAPIWLTIGILTSKKGSEQRAQLKIFLGGVMLLLSPVLLYAIVTLPLLWVNNSSDYPKITGPEPKVQRAGFPFTVSYTVAGEPATFEGTLVCEFGTYREKADGTGRYRTWGESYGGGRTGQTIYRQKDIKEYYDGIQWAPCAALSQGLDEEDRYDLRIKICFGNPGYYMGDGEKDPQYPCVEVGVYWVPEEWIEFSLAETTIYGEEIYDSPILAAYGIQITGVEIADPIENSFSEPDEGKT